MPTERDKAEIEQIMQMPEAERQALMGRMSAACDEIESTLDRIRRDPRSNRLLSELDQVKANVRDNPDSIPEVAAVFGCSEDDVREWIAGEPLTVDCDKCGGTGFTGKGTGYGDICGNCVAGKIPAKD